MSLFYLPDSPLFKIASPEDILLSPKPWFVALTLAFAFTTNLLPLSGFALALRPDFFALVVKANARVSATNHGFGDSRMSSGLAILNSGESGK